MRWFLGIDISKQRFDACLLDSQTSLVKSSKFDQSLEGFEALLRWLEPIDTKALFVAMESTGSYHKLLLRFLIEQGIATAVVNPMLIKHHIQSSSLRKSKTDRLDAASIAAFAMTHRHNLRCVGNEAFDALRPLLKERESLSKQIASMKSDIKALVDLLFPELSKNTNIFTKSILHLLLQAPSRKRIRNLKEKKIARILSQACGNKAGITAKEILTLAKRSIALNDSSLEKVLQSKIRRLHLLLDERQAIEASIDELIETSSINDDIDTLTSIDGIGKTTATHFLGEVGNIKRFSSVKKLCAFSGLDPAIYQSGSSLNTQGRISKRGNPSLRRTLWQMALGVIRNNLAFKHYFEKKRQEGKPFKKAVIAVANKLLRLIYALLKNQTKFDPNRYNKQASGLT